MIHKGNFLNKFFFKWRENVIFYVTPKMLVEFESVFENVSVPRRHFKGRSVHF